MGTDEAKQPSSVKLRSVHAERGELFLSILGSKRNHGRALIRKVAVDLRVC